MCQNNLENWASKTSHHPFLRTNPTPIDSQNQPQPHLHYQRHTIKVSISQIDSYCQLLQGRINNKHPYVCNVLSFQLLPQKQLQYSNSKQDKEVVVWTDKMIPLREHDWTRENIIKMLQGFKRLAMIYGHFAISTQQICKNQNSEIKVWISQIAQKCKVDRQVANQKDMLKNIAMIVQKSNSQLAFKINAGRTMREAIESINSTHNYISQEKFYKTSDFSEFKRNKNMYSTCTTTFMPSKSFQNPQSKPQSFNYSYFPQNNNRTYNQRPFFLSYNSTFNSTTMTRPQSRVYHPVPQQGVIRKQQYPINNQAFADISNERKKVHFVATNSNQESSLDSRHLTFTPNNRFQPKNPHGVPFSHRFKNEREQSDREAGSHINNFDITIINNNVNNFINNFLKNKSSSGSKSPVYNKYSSPYPNKKAKSQGKASHNTSFWLNPNKVSKQRSNSPLFFQQKKKPKSSHQQYTLDSMEDSAPQFTRNTTESLKMDLQDYQNARKIKKLYTFCNPKDHKYQFQRKEQSLHSPTENQNYSQKPNFFKKMTPSTSYNRSNTTQFFPSKGTVNNNKTVEVWPNESREKRFNSFAVDIHRQQELSQQIPTTKSMGIDQNTSSASSKKLQLKKQIKMEFGNLFNIAEANQSPRCSYSQKITAPLLVSQSKTELLKESILKQKIKQKNQAFAQLKKQALKVLDF